VGPEALVDTGQLGLLVGQVEVSQLEAGGDRLIIVDGSGGLKDCAGVGFLGEVHLDAEVVAGGDEAAVADVSGLLEDGHRPSELMPAVQQPRGRLGQGFEHQDPGQDGERGEVVGEVFLGEGHVLDGHHALVTDGFDFVQKVELHARDSAPRGTSLDTQ
jgi:hypothetical protein